MTRARDEGETRQACGDQRSESDRLISEAAAYWADRQREPGVEFEPIDDDDDAEPERTKST